MIALGDGPGSVFPYPANLTGYYGGMRDAHDARANVVFCDGHVEYRKIVDWMKADDLDVDVGTTITRGIRKRGWTVRDEDLKPIEVARRVVSWTKLRARDKFLRLGGKRQAIIACSVRVESRFPEVRESTAGADAAQSQDIFRSGYAPEHARLFAASADDRLAAGFDDP
jgi:prepilin-type processing-associated H-X9-DG protein